MPCLHALNDCTDGCYRTCTLFYVQVLEARLHGASEAAAQQLEEAKARAESALHRAVRKGDQRVLVLVREHEAVHQKWTQEVSDLKAQVTCNLQQFCAWWFVLPFFG